MSIIEQLQEAIEGYGSVYAVARDSGVSQSCIQRFMVGERDLLLATADRLCEFFGMHLTRPTTKPPKMKWGRPIKKKK